MFTKFTKCTDFVKMSKNWKFGARVHAANATVFVPLSVQNAREPETMTHNRATSWFEKSAAAASKKRN